MLKLYKRIDDILHYHEAWVNGSKVAEHWGIVGQRGETKEHKGDRTLSGPDNIVRVLQPALDAGYRPIEPEDHATLLIEYAVDGMGTKCDVEKRHALEDRMNETLGWTGLGACDGGSIGSGTMEVCCFVVDFDVAKRVIIDDLRDTQVSDYSRIYDENETAK